MSEPHIHRHGLDLSQYRGQDPKSVLPCRQCGKPLIAVKAHIRINMMLSATMQLVCTHCHTVDGPDIQAGGFYMVKDPRIFVRMALYQQYVHQPRWKQRLLRILRRRKYSFPAFGTTP